MLRRLRPLVLGLLQVLCVAALAWLLWPKTIAMRASQVRAPAESATRRTPRAPPSGPVFLAGDVLLDGRSVASRVTLWGPVSAQTVTDESGGFRFELGPTLQWLADRAADTEHVSWGDPETTQVTVCAAAGAHVACASPTISLGQEPSRLQLELAVGSLLSGRVVDEHDQPRAGATVEATGVAGQALSTQTAPDGRFALSAPPGRYELHAKAPRTLRELAVPVTLEPNATAELTLRLWSAASLSGTVVDPKGARVRWSGLSVRRGQQTSARAVQPSKGQFEVDGLAPGPYRIEVEAEGFAVQEFEATAPADDLRLTLQPGLTVVGTVFDVDGLPHEGARVAALAEERMTRVLGATYTDAYGSFRIDGLAPGAAYYVVAMTEPKPGESSVCAAERVILFEKTSGLNLRFEPGRSIRGVVVDAHGRPVPEAWIEAFPDGIAMVQGPLSTYRATFAQADEKGAFTLGHLRFDRYRIFAQRPGFARRADSRTLAATGDANVRLVLSEEGQVRGRVLRPGGAPATELSVNGRLVRSADGSFSVPVTRGPEVELAIEAKGFAQEVRRVKAGREAVVTVEDIVLAAPRSVEGVVTDAVTGEPLPEAFVRLAEKDLPDTEEARAHVLSPAVRTDAQGRFRIEDAPAAGTLVVRRAGYLSAGQAVTSEANRIAVALKAGARVSGRVAVNHGLGALAKARVVLRSGGRVLGGDVAADAAFQVDGLWPGRWDVDVIDGDRPLDVLPRSVDVPAEGLTGLVLAMREGGTRVSVAGLFDQWAFLVPGQAALPKDFAAFQELWRGGVWGEQGLDGALFRSVEPGTYTLFVAQEEKDGRELGYYTLPMEVSGSEPLAVQARAPKFVTTLPIPPGP
ncbi:MAG: carboxypeptidase regulatory-like domain-containing protein [Myxococcales bacterium]